MPNTKNTVIMSPPDYFDIEYSINPWMNLDNQVVKDVAISQWQALYQTYLSLGLTIDCIPPVPGLPDLVFTTDHGVFIDGVFYLSNFRYPERQKEQSLAKDFYEKRHTPIHAVPSICYMEGGDVMYRDGTIFVGYGFRTAYETLDYLHNTTRRPTVALELVDEAFYHLDTCFLPISSELAFYYPPAFSPQSIKSLKAHFDMLLPVTSREAENFACNSVKIGNSIICQPNPSFEQQIASLGLSVITLNMHEFNKSGGGIHCLSQIIET